MKKSILTLISVLLLSVSSCYPFRCHGVYVCGSEKAPSKKPPEKLHIYHTCTFK